MDGLKWNGFDFWVHYSLWKVKLTFVNFKFFFKNDRRHYLILNQKLIWVSRTHSHITRTNRDKSGHTIQYRMKPLALVSLRYDNRQSYGWAPFKLISINDGLIPDAPSPVAFNIDSLIDFLMNKLNQWHNSDMSYYMSHTTGSTGTDR